MVTREVESEYQPGDAQLAAAALVRVEWQAHNQYLCFLSPKAHRFYMPLVEPKVLVCKQQACQPHLYHHGESISYLYHPTEMIPRLYVLYVKVWMEYPWKSWRSYYHPSPPQ